MKILEYHVQNYKSLHDVHMNDIGNLIVLIGENGSGKTNLLESLRIFLSELGLQHGESGLESHHWFKKNVNRLMRFEAVMSLGEQEAKFIVGDALYDLLSKQSKKQVMKLELSRTINRQNEWTTKWIRIGGHNLVKDDEPTTTVDFLSSLNLRLPFNIIEFTDQSEAGSITTFIHQPKKKVVFWASDDIRALAEKKAARTTRIGKKTPSEWAKDKGIRVEARYAELNEFGLGSAGEIIERLEHLVSTAFELIPPMQNRNGTNERLLIEPEMLEDVRQVALSDDYRKEEEWEQFKGTFESVHRGSLTTRGNDIFVVEEGRRLPIESMGGGHQSWFIYQRSLRSGGGIYAIEEPESHLHPDLARRTFRFIRAISMTTQVIITTHSPIFVDRKNKKSNWIVEIRNGETSVYRLQSFMKALNAVGARPGDRFASESVILVEGISDKVFLEKCAEKLNVAMENLRIVPLRGKGNLRKNLSAWEPVIRGTQIRLHAMLDRDAQCEVVKLVKRGIIGERGYLLLDNDLESLYPKEIVKDVLSSVFEIDVTPMEMMTGVDSKWLDERFKEKGLKKDDWKVKLAEEVGSRVSSDQIHDSVKQILKGFSR